MAAFMIRFFICNLFTCGIIGIIFMLRRILKNVLSARQQYHLWFLLLGLMAVPFLPFRLTGLLQEVLWFMSQMTASSSGASLTHRNASGRNPGENADWVNDFALSVNSKLPPLAGYLLLAVWLTGILAMMILIIQSLLKLRNLKESALPLQNQEIRRLYAHCLEEMKLHMAIPVYSTAFLTSPIITGLLKPCIYLPLHLISDYNRSDMRFMLLHELQHYRHRDSAANCAMSLAAVLYWFNPLVWYALKEMRSDQEIACDTSVLNMLHENEYKDYGNTLINLAEKISLTPYPFASGLGGNIKQMKRRIVNIASYKRPTTAHRLKGMAAFLLTGILLAGFAPFLSAYASDEEHYRWDSSSKNISVTDLSAYFEKYEGSFVLYDLKHNTWRIHNKKRATLRTAPDSTYKIYDALFGLEEGIITPDNSLISWDGKNYPFEAWNADQTLQSAMSASVNWYFQAIDERLDPSTVYGYLRKTGYGNENIGGDFPAYWLESSLKISPVEQVELLTGLQSNRFGFAPENIRAVKDAICLSSSDAGAFYGKTGTGRIDGQEVNGWFIGFIETADNTYFFAANIDADKNASGSTAAKITMSILSDMNIWK